MEQTSWPPEHSDALRKYLAARLPFSEIVKAINLKFKTAYTRNAAIGRARRMGVAGSDRPQPLLQAVPPRLERIVKTAPVEPGAAALRRPTPPLKTQEPPKLRCAEVEPRHLSLIELERGDCHYPYGGDEEGEAITFCGHPRQPGSSYFAPHFQLSRNPVASPEREAIDNAIWLRIVETA
ncbi:GcrA family cell cycle regulator [Afipia sp. GAS231]|uniref:GcrA family cell cycle regulator n=1 Tax=Afipia sp. GAS231 TaxID=1882747 RepID=UPI00087B9D11|nr:GcrA family cell cycle regulator [Afipia sp. GAS231]SDN50786.1 GcrA cell cycle regulator [Afipia sp. GAS231]